jgi:hypothetical protein
MSKVKNPSTSDVKQRHKRKGGGSKPHSSRGRIGTATIKKNVDASARRANQRVAGANIKPKKKPIVSRMTGGQIIAAIYD